MTAYISYRLHQLQEGDYAIDKGRRLLSYGLGIRRVLLIIAHPLRA
jgi:hypothetical protein